MFIAIVKLELFLWLQLFVVGDVTKQSENHKMCKNLNCATNEKNIDKINKFRVCLCRWCWSELFVYAKTENHFGFNALRKWKIYEKFYVHQCCYQETFCNLNYLQTILNHIKHQSTDHKALGNQSQATGINFNLLALATPASAIITNHQT